MCDIDRFKRFRFKITDPIDKIGSWVIPFNDIISLLLIVEFIFTSLILINETEASVSIKKIVIFELLLTFIETKSDNVELMLNISSIGTVLVAAVAVVAGTAVEIADSARHSTGPVGFPGNNEHSAR